jgi:hypothetical protein
MLLSSLISLNRDEVGFKEYKLNIITKLTFRKKTNIER